MQTSKLSRYITNTSNKNRVLACPAEIEAGRVHQSGGS